MLTVDDLPFEFENEVLNHFIVYLWNTGLTGPRSIFPLLSKFQDTSYESLAAGVDQSINVVRQMLHSLEYHDLIALKHADGKDVHQLDDLDAFTYVLFIKPTECRQFRRDLKAGLIKARVNQWQAEQRLKAEPPAPPPAPTTPPPAPAPQPKQQSRKGYVYLIKASTGHYKIGHTADPENRMKTFEVKLPFKVEYEHLIECDDRIDAERLLHQKFADKRIDGEWFALSDKDIAQIKKIKRIPRQH